MTTSSVSTRLREIAPHGEVTVTREVRPAGVVAYRFTGRRIHGTIIVEPYVRDEQPIPNTFAVTLGDDHPFLHKRPDLPVVNGTTVLGGHGPLDLTDPTWPGYLLLTRTKVHQPATPAIERALRDVLAIVAELHAELDQAELLLAGARASAGRRLAQCARGIGHTWQVVHEITTDLADTYRLAAQLQALSPLPLVPPARPCASWHPCLDPDDLVTADDDGDWLTCRRCGQYTVMIAAGASLGSLLADHAAHHCQV